MLGKEWKRRWRIVLVFFLGYEGLGKVFDRHLLLQETLLGDKDNAILVFSWAFVQFSFFM